MSSERVREIVEAGTSTRGADLQIGDLVAYEGRPLNEPDRFRRSGGDMRLLRVKRRNKYDVTTESVPYGKKEKLPYKRYWYEEEDRETKYFNVDLEYNVVDAEILDYVPKE